jgi:hypothetical protein
VLLFAVDVAGVLSSSAVGRGGGWWHGCSSWWWFIVHRSSDLWLQPAVCSVTKFCAKVLKFDFMNAVQFRERLNLSSMLQFLLAFFQNGLFQNR